MAFTSITRVDPRVCSSSSSRGHRAMAARQQAVLSQEDGQFICRVFGFSFLASRGFTNGEARVPIACLQRPTLTASRSVVQSRPPSSTASCPDALQRRCATRSASSLLCSTRLFSCYRTCVAFADQFLRQHALAVASCRRLLRIESASSSLSRRVTTTLPSLTIVISELPLLGCRCSFSLTHPLYTLSLPSRP